MDLFLDLSLAICKDPIYKEQLLLNMFNILDVRDLILSLLCLLVIKNIFLLLKSILYNFHLFFPNSSI